eukprot:m51a1_g11214 hypothetical protein (241) ;mRNA; r:11460-19758
MILRIHVDVNANVLVFLREISHFVESANLDKPNAHHLLLSKLVGRAAVIASSWLNLSVVAFTARMVRTWAGEELMVRLRDELDGLVQQPGQSAVDLAAMLNQLYDMIDPKTAEATRLERFKRAVTSDKAHGAFITARPRTVEEAVVLVADVAAEEARMERARVAQGTTGASSASDLFDNYKAPTAVVLIEGRTSEAMLDDGAEANIIQQATFLRTAVHPEISPYRGKMTGWDGNKTDILG